MPQVLDIFNNDAFSASTLTRAITIVPNSYGRIRALGLFRDEPIPTTSVDPNLAPKLDVQPEAAAGRDPLPSAPTLPPATAGSLSADRGESPHCVDEGLVTLGSARVRAHDDRA